MEIIQKFFYQIFCGNHKAANNRSAAVDPVKSYTSTGCNIALKEHFFLDSHLDFLPENLWAVSDFTRRFQPWNSGTKANRVPERWLIIVGHLEEKFHMQNIAESHPQPLFRYCIIPCIINFIHTNLCTFSYNHVFVFQVILKSLKTL